MVRLPGLRTQETKDDIIDDDIKQWTEKIRNLFDEKGRLRSQHQFLELLKDCLRQGKFYLLDTFFCGGLAQEPIFEKLKSEPKGVCGYSYDKSYGEPAFQCRTCASDPTVIMCVDCFRESDHDGHEYILHQARGGMCDCGDQTSFDIGGLCKWHRGPAFTEKLKLPEQIQESGYYTIRYLTWIMSSAFTAEKEVEYLQVGDVPPEVANNQTNAKIVLYYLRRSAFPKDLLSDDAMNSTTNWMLDEVINFLKCTGGDLSEWEKWNCDFKKIEDECTASEDVLRQCVAHPLQQTLVCCGRSSFCKKQEFFKYIVRPTARILYDNIVRTEVGVKEVFILTNKIFENIIKWFMTHLEYSDAVRNVLAKVFLTQVPNLGKVPTLETNAVITLHLLLSKSGKDTKKVSVSFARPDKALFIPKELEVTKQEILDYIMLHEKWPIEEIPSEIVNITDPKRKTFRDCDTVQIFGREPHSYKGITGYEQTPMRVLCNGFHQRRIIEGLHKFYIKLFGNMFAKKEFCKVMSRHYHELQNRTIQTNCIDKQHHPKPKQGAVFDLNVQIFTVPAITLPVNEQENSVHVILNWCTEYLHRHLDNTTLYQRTKECFFLRDV